MLTGVGEWDTRLMMVRSEGDGHFFHVHFSKGAAQVQVVPGNWSSVMPRA